MKYQRFLILFFFCSFSVLGQQIPQFSQYYANKFLYNPAFAGFEDFAEIKSGYRSQWQGIGNTNSTFYINGNMPLGKTDYTSDGPSPNISSSKSYSYKKTYTRGKEHRTGTHKGVGFQLMADNWGPVQSLSFAASYAFHLPVGGENKVSGGFSLGSYYRTISLGYKDYDVSNPNDPLLNSLGKLSASQNLFNMGVTYYNRTSHVGLAIWQPIMGSFNFSAKSDSVYSVLPNASQTAKDTISITKNSLGQMPTVFILQGGTRWDLSEDIKVYPSVMLKFTSLSHLTAEGTLRTMLKEKIWAGVSYRFKEAVGFHLGALLGPKTTLNYSYDIHTGIGPFSTAYSSSEFTLGYMFYWKK
ncbi:type IX secretion system membrane protein PorP/SprF [Sandaracinomonas limnophila]|uniref:Type IX secretion system membrane protein PorP/SprF n=1 Tax=Sandaracinomonas limnophila TaxID=1862386 RepID=A0A437PUG1_9BACT|nr:PorP/SprF family type IX secretion system membrane protein [Sandaracinomonas limnophila]RVU25877.1 type IX secretion system membrane protein PorP/SprF [Sandaracinomonas limnophila]